jgi:hypothetical protein
LNVPINALCTSGGLKHKTHSEHGIVLRLGLFKTTILQPLWNAYFIDPSRLQDGGFEQTYLKTIPCSL